MEFSRWHSQHHQQSLLRSRACSVLSHLLPNSSVCFLNGDIRWSQGLVRFTSSNNMVHTLTLGWADKLRFYYTRRSCISHFNNVTTRTWLWKSHFIRFANKFLNIFFWCFYLPSMTSAWYSRETLRLLLKKLSYPNVISVICLLTVIHRS